MSLDYLKEQFGVPVVKKGKDNREKIHETLDSRFNSNIMDGFKTVNQQHQEDLEEKDRIIENLKQELDSKWLENKVAFNAKKVYEDKIKKMSIVDSTKLIPILIDVAKQKQKNQVLDWKNWLEIPENNYLFQINESLGKKVFNERNRTIQRIIDRKRRTIRGSGGNYALSFSGDRSGAADSHATTTFNPDTYSLWNGFTISFWVRPDEEMNQKSVILGTRASSPVARFHFGLSGTGVNNIGVGIGGNDVTGINNPMEVGKWYNWVISYTGTQFDAGERKLRLWINTDERMSNNNSTSWNNQDEATESYTHGIYFGGRNTEGSGYTSGFACALDEVAIYNRCIDSDGTFASEVYNAGTNYNHLNNGQSGLVGYWKFNEGSGTTITDHSGNGNHGIFGAISGDTTAFPTWEER